MLIQIKFVIQTLKGMLIHCIFTVILLHVCASLAVSSQLICDIGNYQAQMLCMLYRGFSLHSDGIKCAEVVRVSQIS